MFRLNTTWRGLGRRFGGRAGWLLLLSLLVGGLPEAPARAAGLERVRVQLKRRHQFEFAGYYAALEKGFYRDAGLEVELQEAAERVNPVDSVLKGQSEFGIAGPELVRYRAAGVPVVAVAAIFQHSPAVLICRHDRDIRQLTDLAGKRLYLEPEAADLLALLKLKGLESNHFTNCFETLANTFSVDSLLQGRVDAMSAYLTDELFVLSNTNLGYMVFSPRNDGIDFYGDILFTTEQLVAEQPRLVRAFREATLKGWEYALAHQGEIIQLLLDKHLTRHSPEHLRFEALQMQRLLDSQMVEIGYMSPPRWQSIIDTYRRLNMLRGEVELDRFVYAPTPPPIVIRHWKGTVLAAGVALAALLLSARYRQLALRLRRENQQRQATEEALRKEVAEHKQARESLQAALAQVKTLSGLLPICAGCKKIRDDRGYWNQIEIFIHEHSGASFTHGLCPECARTLYPDYFPEGE